MHSKFLIVQVCKFLNDGDGMYRLHDPSRFLSKIPGVVVIDCHFAHRLLPKLLRMADLVVMQFVHNWDWFPVIEQRRADGHATVYEVNDNIYDVQPWNPVATGWRDQSMRAECEKYIAASDAMQTSSEFLANLFKPVARRVVAFPNQLTSVPPLEPPPERPLTVGFGGSVGHFADWYAISPLLQKWLIDRHEIHLSVMTNDYVKSFIDIPADRYHFTPFGSLADYNQFLKTLDIGLAPLLPMDYNRGRSDVKFLEFAAAGVAGIYANLDPYRDSVSDRNTGLLYSNERQLLKHLNTLADDARLRNRIREAAHEHVSNERLLENHITRRLEFYRSLLPKPAQSTVLPQEIVAAAEINGRYLQLKPGEPEQIFIVSQTTPLPPNTVENLSRVTAAYPDYQMALVTMGRFLNDANKFDQALHMLKRAFELEPTSAAALCELSRSHYFRKEVTASRECFETALRVNPLYYPGWCNLLRFLKFTPSSDALTWAARAREHFPNDFALALLAIALHPATDRIQLLTELLDTSACIPDADSTAHLQPLEQTIFETIRATGVKLETVAMLKRACALFPDSARLEDMLGRTLYVRGKSTESLAHYRRALEIRRTSRAFVTEFPQDDGSHYAWQIADIVARKPKPKAAKSSKKI